MHGRHLRNPQPVAIADDRGQSRAILLAQKNTDGLCHASRIARLNANVNPMFVSLHYLVHAGIRVTDLHAPRILRGRVTFSITFRDAADANCFLRAFSAVTLNKGSPARFPFKRPNKNAEAHRATSWPRQSLESTRR